MILLFRVSNRRYTHLPRISCTITKESRLKDVIITSFWRQPYTTQHVTPPECTRSMGTEIPRTASKSGARYIWMTWGRKEKVVPNPAIHPTQLFPPHPCHSFRLILYYGIIRWYRDDIRWYTMIYDIPARNVKISNSISKHQVQCA